MRFLLLSFSLLGVFLLTDKPHLLLNSSIEECCGKCVGSAYCTACTNCSRCKHCSGGGACGVCSSSNNINRSSKSSNSVRPSEPAVSSGNVYSRFVPPTSNQPKETTFASKKSDLITPPAAASVAWVNSEVLNVRKGPGTEYEIIGRLSKGDEVRVLENSSGKWILIQSKKIGNPASVIVKGYVCASFLRR